MNANDPFTAEVYAAVHYTGEVIRNRKLSLREWREMNLVIIKFDGKLFRAKDRTSLTNGDEMTKEDAEGRVTYFITFASRN